jgi:hypothetical protein
MSERKRATGSATATATAKAEARAEATATAIEQRLAGIHLRLGSFALARAELEHLAAGDRLDVAGLADLAEVRWRMGDLETAAEAAAAHLAADGAEPIARVIAAEAAAAAGRPAEARSHSAAVGGLTTDELEARFAGMPRRALWPAMPSATNEALEAFGSSRAGEHRGNGTAGGAVAGIAAASRTRAATGAAAAAADRGQSEDQGPGLWTDDGADDLIDRARPPRTTAPESDPTELLARGRAEVRSGTVDRLAAGLDRLGLALRLDPTLAPGVLDAIGRHHEPAALLVRGDAYRILGRTIEAEAAYLAAASALDIPGGRGGGLINDRDETPDRRHHVVSR